MLVAVITTKLLSLKLMLADKKLKTIIKLLMQIYNNIDENGSDGECSDLYH